MMDCAYVRALFQSYREKVSIIHIIDSIQDIALNDSLSSVVEGELNIFLGNTEMHTLQKRKKALQIVVEFIDALLSGVALDCQFIIRCHLINGLDWGKTMYEMEQRWGKEQCLTERALKRKQTLALAQLVDTLRNENFIIP